MLLSSPPTLPLSLLFIPILLYLYFIKQIFHWDGSTFSSVWVPCVSTTSFTLFWGKCHRETPPPPQTDPHTHADTRKTGIQAFTWTEGDNERLVQSLSHQQWSSMAEWPASLARSSAQENKAKSSSQSGRLRQRQRVREPETGGWEMDNRGKEDHRPN